MNTTQRIITFAVVATMLLIGFAVFVQRYVSRSRALAPITRVTLSPLENGAFSLYVKPDDSKNKISIMDIHLDAKYGEVVAWDECVSPLDSGLLFTELGKKSGTSARYSCSIIKDAAQLPNSVVLTGRVACKDPSAKTVKLSLNTKSAVGGPIEGVQYSVLSNESIDIPCDGSIPKPQKDVVMSIDAATSGVSGCNIAKVGEKCIMDVREEVKLPGHKLSAVYTKLSYDSSLIELDEELMKDAQLVVKVPQKVLGEMTRRLMAQTNTDPSTLTGIPTLIPEPITPTASPTASITPTATVTPTPSPSSVLTPTVFPTTTPTTAPVKKDCTLYYTTNSVQSEIELLHVCTLPESELKNMLKQALVFIGKAQGKGEVRVESVQAIGPSRSGASNPAKLYSVEKTSEPVTVGGKGASVKLDMRLRLQCVVKQPKATQKLNVRVGVADGKLKKPLFETAEFTADSQGFWNGTVSFNVPEGTQYKLLVKGDKHMQKKICDTAPQEDYPGAYRCDKGRVTLKEGTQFVDLSKIILVTGDLPPGEQDGISNAKDQSLVRNLIGKTDPESAKLADINYDGVVNAVDHSCMIAALSVRYDEE